MGILPIDFPFQLFIKDAAHRLYRLSLNSKLQARLTLPWAPEKWPHHAPNPPRSPLTAPTDFPSLPTFSMSKQPHATMQRVLQWQQS